MPARPRKSRRLICLSPLITTSSNSQTGLGPNHSRHRASSWMHSTDETPANQPRAPCAWFAKERTTRHLIRTLIAEPVTPVERTPTRSISRVGTKAGVQPTSEPRTCSRFDRDPPSRGVWIPAFAGMTESNLCESRVNPCLTRGYLPPPMCNKRRRYPGFQLTPNRAICMIATQQ